MQAVYYRQFQNKSFPDISKLLAVPVRTLGTWLKNYRDNGLSGLRTKKNENRARAYLTLEEEKALLSDLEEEAMSGSFVVAHAIHGKAEDKIGHPVSKDYAYTNSLS